MLFATDIRWSSPQASADDYRLMYQLAMEQARIDRIRLRAKTRQARQDRDELQRYLRSQMEGK